MGFFNDLGKKATETYKNTTDKTNKIAREMKLKSYINENKNRIEDVYTEIGKKVYERFNEGSLAEIDEYIKPELERIAEYARKIENMNSEIRLLNNIKLCSNCASEIDLNAKFCPKCGTQQITQEIEKNTDLNNSNIVNIENNNEEKREEGNNTDNNEQSSEEETNTDNNEQSNKE